MPFSRSSPSQRYRSLVDLYGRMHAEGDPSIGFTPERTFHGASLLPQVLRIKRLIERTGAETLLDYGCGKAQLYDLGNLLVKGHGNIPSIVAFWEITGVCFYDPAYAPFRQLPVGEFDGVIATDMLEHCPEEDLPWILDEIFGYARRFVFASVASYPARKLLPNGENAHCTLRPPQWWDARLRETARGHPDLVWEIWVEERDQYNASIDRRFASFDNGN